MEISLSNSTFGMMKGGTSQNLSSFYFHNSWIYVEIMTQNVNFLIKWWPVQYLDCRNTQRMYKVTLVVKKVHIVYIMYQYIVSLFSFGYKTSLSDFFWRVCWFRRNKSTFNFYSSTDQRSVSPLYSDGLLFVWIYGRNKKYWAHM